MKKIYYIFAALLILVSACKKEASIKEEELKTPEKTITYHLKNGGEVTVAINSKREYVVGGDVILSKDQIAYLEYNKVGDGKETTPRSTFTAEYQKLWPGGIVYYVINDAAHSSNILNAMSDWEASTPIRFVQRTNQSNYVNFQGAPPNGGGDSQLGMVGGQQLIRLAASADKSTVIHEIGHAVGLMHEQTRADRDQYINVNFSNINSTWSSQYATYNVLGISGFQIGTFDFNSIMLYRSYASEASVNGNTSPQMTRKDGSTWWDNDHLSQGDIDGVNYLYTPIIIDLFYTDEYINEQNEYVNKSTRSANIKFYDKNLTQMALTKQIKIKIVSTRKEYYNHNYTYEIHESTATLPIGTTEFYLGTDTFNEQYDQHMNEMDGSYTISYNVVRIM
nr:M12 family metallopeptidase [Pedobacter kyonggii]